MEQLIKECFLQVVEERDKGVVTMLNQKMLDELCASLAAKLQEKGVLPPTTEDMEEQANKYATTVIGLTGSPYVSKEQVIEDFAAGWQAREQAQ